MLVLDEDDPDAPDVLEPGEEELPWLPLDVSELVPEVLLLEVLEELGELLSELLVVELLPAPVLVLF